MADLAVAALRRRLRALWRELEQMYGAVILREGHAQWDALRLRAEIEWAEWRLRVLDEGVRVGWRPPEVDEGLAA